MLKLKNKKGITLIALIITIIVMLILVGVTINVALNGGLFETAPNKIDYIFVSEELSNAFVKSEVWKDSHDGIFLSDHYPVCAEFEY